MKLEIYLLISVFEIMNIELFNHNLLSWLDAHSKSPPTTQPSPLISLLIAVLTQTKLGRFSNLHGID